jgi:hypothetical protein
VARRVGVVAKAGSSDMSGRSVGISAAGGEARGETAGAHRLAAKSRAARRLLPRTRSLRVRSWWFAERVGWWRPRRPARA